MIEFVKLLNENPSVYILLLVMLVSLGFILYKFVARRYSLDTSTYEEVVNARAKELVNKLSERVDELEKDRDRFHKEKQDLQEDNLKLAMLNAMLLSNNSIIRGIPYWVFSYPDNKAMYLSVEYGDAFLDEDMSITDYINYYNDKVWDSESAQEYNENNKKAAVNGVWFGFETIKRDGQDFSKDYLILKLGLKDTRGKVSMTMGVALDIRGDAASLYFNEFLEDIDKFKKNKPLKNNKEDE